MQLVRMDQSTAQLASGQCMRMHMWVLMLLLMLASATCSVSSTCD